MNTVEFRDPSGSYVLALPVDEVRCRVLASNVLGRGQLAYKDPEMTWDEAARDLGGFTRLSPEDLAPETPEEVAEELVLRDLEAGNRSFSRTSDDGLGLLARIPDPASLGQPPEGTDDLRGVLERLLVHYVRAHAGRPARRLAQTRCECPGFRAGASRGQARLHALVGLALAAKGFSDLDSLVHAYRDRTRARVKAA